MTTNATSVVALDGPWHAIAAEYPHCYRPETHSPPSHDSIAPPDSARSSRLDQRPIDGRSPAESAEYPHWPPAAPYGRDRPRRNSPDKKSVPQRAPTGYRTLMDDKITGIRVSDRDIEEADTGSITEFLIRDELKHHNLQGDRNCIHLICPYGNG
jgi:hypothetical protein